MNKVLILFFCVVFLNSCNFFVPRTVVLRIKGSDTMLSFTEMLAREYMRKKPNVAIYVYGGGSREGIDAIASGEAEIATASRLLTPNEVKSLVDKHSTVGVSYLIAKDAISIYLNPENKVKDISFEDLRKIFTCRINNWSELGGEDAPINIYTRNPNSGTYIYFQQFVLSGEKYCAAAKIEPSMSRIISRVAKDKNAIGYGGIGTHDDIAHALINGIEPSEENVRNDSYPISRYLYFITLNNSKGDVKDFIDWALSNEAQSFIKKAGYVPIWKLTF